MSKGKGEFFAVEVNAWELACGVGLNPAIAYLVMARGTGRDNVTTMWSAEAVFRHSGIAWRRADAAIRQLIEEGLVTKLKAGKRPRYKLTLPGSKEDLIWLPNSLVTGAGDEVPPIAKLRQTQELSYLRAYIGLYDMQDLTGDGGLPRSLMWHPMETRKRIMSYGPFDVVGFTKQSERYCNTTGPLAVFKGDDPPSAWDFLTTLERLGLLEWVIYLADSESPDSELIHPLTGDEHAEGVASAAFEFASELPGGFKYETENFDFVLPIPSHMAKATLVGVGRLRYRPRTARTSAWYAQHVKSCQEHEAMYKRLQAGDFKSAEGFRAASGGQS